MVAIFPPIRRNFVIFAGGLVSNYFIVLLFVIIQAVVLLIVDLAFFDNFKSLVERLHLVGTGCLLVVINRSQRVNRTTLDNVQRSIFHRQLWLSVQTDFSDPISVALSAGLGR